MTLNQAVKRFKWRLGNKNFNPNSEDRKAFNTILEWIKASKEESIYQNRLFAKLYIERLAKEIVFYKSDYKTAMTVVERILNIPLEKYYKRFGEEMKHNEILNFGEMLGIDKPINWMNEERQEVCKSELKTNESEFIKVIESDFWNNENTIHRLNDLLTDVINSNKNKP